MILRLFTDLLFGQYFGWLVWACVDHVAAHGFPALGCPLPVTS